LDLSSTKKLLLALTVAYLASTMSVALAGDGGGETDDLAADISYQTGLEWPTEYKDNCRTGRSDFVGPQTPDIKWVYETGSTTRSWAVIGNNGSVISGFQGKVVCVDPMDGTLLWEFSTEPSQASTCCMAEDGGVYVSAGNKVYALSEMGTELWSYDIGSEADEPSVGSDGTIYVGSAGGRLAALSEDGKMLWDFKIPGNIRSPSIDKTGNLYCGASPWALYALDSTGRTMWVFKPEGDLPLYEGVYTWGNCLEMPSIGDDGTVYTGSSLAPGIDYATGKPIPGYSFVAHSKLYAVSPQGQKKWEYSHPESKWTIKSPSIGRDGTLYAGTDCWRVIALDAEGSVIWEFNTGEDFTVCPSVYSPSIGKDGLLYAATTSAKIFCITPEGTEKWRFAAENPWLAGWSGSNNFTPPPIGDDGTLFSNLAQGRIYAFKTTEMS